MAKCLVLGADGFLGSHLSMSLIKNHTVVGYDKFNHGRTLDCDIEKIEGNFSDSYRLKKALEGVDYVFNFISSSNPAKSLKDPLSDIIHLQTSVNFINMCCDAGVKKIIYPSTGGAIYGRCSDKPFKEDDAVNPISPYAINKLALEGYLKYFRNSRGLDYVIYRISNPYGPLQNVTGAQGIIPIYLNNIKNNLPLTVFGDGSMRRDYIYIKDTIDMICSSFEKTSQDIYNLGSGSSHTINDIIYEISKVTKKSVQINYMPDRATDIKNVELDMSRYYNEYGTRASTSLLEGIYHTWQYVKNISQ